MSNNAELFYPFRTQDTKLILLSIPYYTETCFVSCLILFRISYKPYQLSRCDSRNFGVFKSARQCSAQNTVLTFIHVGSKVTNFYFRFTENEQ